MPIIFDGVNATPMHGGGGGGPFQASRGAPYALVGMRYDCRAFTPDAGDFPGWTIFYKFLRAIIPLYAALEDDGTVSKTIIEGERIGNTEFVEAASVTAPHGYVVTGINLRSDILEAAGRPEYIKAFQFIYSLWTPQGINSSERMSSLWQGGDGQLPEGALHYGETLIRNSPNAPTESKSGTSDSFAAGDGGCMIGLVGHSGNVIDALGGLWTIPQVKR